MTTPNPITPPPELVQQWNTEGRHQDYCTLTESIAARAAQWGADQELLACGNYLKQCAAWEEEDVTEFYNYRRPKPPSLKEQALKAARIELDPTGKNGSLILRALEALPDD